MTGNCCCLLLLHHCLPATATRGLPTLPAFMYENAQARAGTTPPRWAPGAIVNPWCTGAMAPRVRATLLAASVHGTQQHLALLGYRAPV